MKKATPQSVLDDIALMGPNYKIKDLDRLIQSYIRDQVDVDELKDWILEYPSLHRIFYYVKLKPMKNVDDRMNFIDQHLLFNDWWQTDQLIQFVSDIDFITAMDRASAYIQNPNPFIRRWGYVLFISKLCRHEDRVIPILSLLKNDDHHTVQMAQAWLIAELAVFFPQQVFAWFQTSNRLSYGINSKAIQKIQDSFRIEKEWKMSFKDLRPRLRQQ